MYTVLGVVPQTPQQARPQLEPTVATLTAVRCSWSHRMRGSAVVSSSFEVVGKAAK